MSEKFEPLRLVAAEDWVERFIRCQLSELNGEVLRPDDVQFMDSIETVATLMPGVLEEILLEQGLSSETIGGREANTDVLERAVARYGVAAATPQPIYERVNAAIEQGEALVEFDIAGEPLALLQIISFNGPLKPCFQENYTFVVEREGTQLQTITPFGGVYLSLDELKSMFLEYISENRTIRLYHS